MEMVSSLLLFMWDNTRNLSLSLSKFAPGPMKSGLGWEEEAQDNGQRHQEVDRTNHIAEDQPNRGQVFYLAAGKFCG